MSNKDVSRVLRLLARGAATIHPSANGKLLLETGSGTFALAGEIVAAMARADLLQRDGTRVVLTAAGRAHLRRADAQGDPMQEQHRVISTQTMMVGGMRETVTVNDAESPLRALAARRDRQGRPFLNAGEVSAGERLRSDYTRGQIMPRLGANWQAAVSSGRRDGGRGSADLTETAMAARMRVERALDAVGPELAGVLVDICCFLKGLEAVERERGWPVRSAKLLLKTALGVLARHYAPPRKKARPQVLHWGAADYRPSLVAGE